MTKFNDVLELAAKVFNPEELREFVVMESKHDPRQRNLVRDKVIEIERETLASVYRDDCDLVIFSQYRHARDFDKLYNQYKDEIYAIGS